MRRVLLLSEAEMDPAHTASFIQSMTYESIIDYEEFPETEEPVWVLGRQYSTLYVHRNDDERRKLVLANGDFILNPKFPPKRPVYGVGEWRKDENLDDIKYDIKSRLWFTYRFGFSAIGGQGPTKDTGWGCMLRCGQMLLAQAMVMRHLGRDWRWVAGKYDPKYHEILRQFQDKKGSCYSIHQIASMGACEGKAVGQWFGPNTIAQVLRKLAFYDEWSSIAVHVAMDNTVIIDDIKMLCGLACSDCKKALPGQESAGSSSEEKGAVPDSLIGACGGVTNGDTPHNSNYDEDDEKSAESGRGKVKWKPLLLIIPLRLGLTEVNPVYISGLKTCLTMPQSVGIIGGKPSHAHWFIGFLEDELIYLDPHTAQPYVDLSQPNETDTSFHCQFPQRLDINQLDPSVALGFYCGTEADFDQWCRSVSKYIVHGQKTPMFELYQTRPDHWPPFTPYQPSSTTPADYTVLGERQFDSEDEFELL